MTSPFGASPALTSAAVAGSIRTRARARARRSVTAFADTSTIRALPSGPVCDSSLIAGTGCGARSPHQRGIGAALRGGDQVADRPLVAGAQQLDRVRLAVHDRLEEVASVLVRRQRRLRPAARLV